ncbi:MAG TPA: hypothetical protein VJ623_12055 [Holophagaceae bacterium]|nr:hypothetical protein [Holophagaceae bacterium]
MNIDIGFRYCQSIDGGFAAWTHEQDTLLLVQGDTIAHLEQALGAALGLTVTMGLTRTAPKLVHLSRSDSVGSISLAGNTGDALLNFFIQSPAQRFEADGLLGVRLATAHLHVIAPKGVLKPELLGHLVHALKDQQDSRGELSWEGFLEKWLSHSKTLA